MAEFLYALIIYPLTIAIETSYQLAYEISGNAGIAVIAVSLAVSFLCLPLYVVAEKWQQIERDKQKQMEPGIARIKKAFKGDEQYMMLTTFYRQNHYHPMMALRSSFGLLIQVPFFIAAYSFLSNMSALQGQGFLFIRDMGKADALFSIGSFPVNVLPIAMTLINIAGSAVYTKGFKLKDKVPIYAMALIFLAILYDSPAGLVLYWTMNNVFSLAKNVFYKLKRPLLVLYIMACAAAACLLLALAFHNGLASKRLVLCVILAAVFLSPLIVRAASWALKNPLAALVQSPRERGTLFLASAFSLALLSGIVIPSNVILSSVVEFTNIDNVQSAAHYVWAAFFQSLGLFVFWLCCVYFLFGKKVQSLMAAGSALLLLWGTVNAFAYGDRYGAISRSLIFNNGVSDALLAKGLNALVLLAAAAAFLLLLKKAKPKNGAIPLCFILLAAFAFISAVNVFKIQKESAVLAQNRVQEEEKIKPAFRLSKSGKNVVVIMADRAESVYAQTIIDSVPKAREAFKDWTLFSNALSYDGHTILGAPPLYGGYEYTPLEMNKRVDVPLKDKNNEALLLMPRVFTEQAGFEAFAYDLSWANYKWIPDMSICDPYPKITGGNLERKYVTKWLDEHPECAQKNAASKTIERNFLWLSIFKATPLFFREAVYDDGSWWSSDEGFTDLLDFISYYSVLDYLPQLTAIDEGGADSFTLLQSMATHSTIALQAPDFVPAKKVTNYGAFEGFFCYDELSVNAAFFLRLAEWMEYLKANGCYDNTRIIVAADHGIGTVNPKDLFFDGSGVFGAQNESGAGSEDSPEQEKERAMSFFYGLMKFGWNPDHNHPLLMMKDFTGGALKADGSKAQDAGATAADRKREWTVDKSFMTNADVPALAFEGIIENPVNPWTGKPIQKRTQSAAYGIAADAPYDPAKHGVYKYNLKGVRMFDVFDDMSKLSNWKERKE